MSSSNNEQLIDSLEEDLDLMAMKLMDLAPKEILDIIMDKAVKLAETGILEKALKTGDKVDLNFDLEDVTGDLVSAKKLLAKGPLVVSFFRGEWCPYCNIQLSALQAIAADVKGKGASLVALSPQTVDHSISSAKKNNVEDFPLISDPGNQVAKQFKIDWNFDEEMKKAHLALGIDLAEYNNGGLWSLPLAATYVLGKDGTILYSFLDTKHWKRAEPADILNAIPITEKQQKPSIFYKIRRKAKSILSASGRRASTGAGAESETNIEAVVVN